MSNEKKHSIDVVGMQTPSDSEDLSQQQDHYNASSPTAATQPVLNLSDRERLQKIHRRMMIKMDIQVVAVAFITYFLSFLDRSNIGQARLNGLQGPNGALKTPHDFIVATAMTYVLYIILEIPSNLILKAATPRIWIPLLLTLWGLVATFQGFSKSPGGFYVARLMLGASEAGILPALALWLTFFYHGHELMLRQSLYFSGSTLSGAFSGLLSTVLGRIHTSNYHGWPFIFFVEGGFTCLVGLLLFFVVPSGPRDLWWLTPEERELAVARMESSFGEKHLGVGAAATKEADSEADEQKDLQVSQEDDYEEPFRLSEVWRAFRDPKNILLAISGFTMATGLYGMAFFSPTLIKAMNPSWTSVHSQLMTCPPYAVAFVVSIVLGILSDRMHRRYPVAAFSSIVAIIGFAMAYGLPPERAWARYGALIMITSGVFSLPAAMLSWLGSVNASHTKKATGIGMFITLTNSGGMASTFMWPTTEAPRFQTGFLTNLILMIVTLLCLTLLEVYIVWENNNKAQGKNDHLVEDLRAQGFSEKRIRIDLGDQHPDFKVML